MAKESFASFLSKFRADIEKRKTTEEVKKMLENHEDRTTLPPEYAEANRRAKTEILSGHVYSVCKEKIDEISKNETLDINQMLLFLLRISTFLENELAFFTMLGGHSFLVQPLTELNGERADLISRLRALGASASHDEESTSWPNTAAHQYLKERQNLLQNIRASKSPSSALSMSSPVDKQTQLNKIILSCIFLVVVIAMLAGVFSSEQSPSPSLR